MSWPATLKSQELSLWEVKLSISLILRDTNQPRDTEELSASVSELPAG